MKRIEIILKNIFLRILLIINGISKSNANKTFDENSRILFIRLNRIGDALVTTPLLHEIKSSLKSKIYVLVDKNSKNAYINNKDIDKLVIFEKGIKGFFNALRFISHEKIDVVVDLHDDVSTTVSFLIAMCKAPNKFGLEKDNKSIYTRTIPRPDSTKYHVVERMMAIAELFNIRVDKSKIKLHYYLTNEEIEKAGIILSEKFKQKRFTLGINISAGSSARFWGIDNFKKLLQFLSGYDINVLLLSSPQDAQVLSEIAGGSYEYFCSNSISNFTAVISRLDFLFTPDTMAIHLASAFSIPVFGIFVKYNTQDVIWSPYNTKFDCIVTTNNNLSDITIEQVTGKLKPFLESILAEHNVSE